MSDEMENIRQEVRELTKVTNENSNAITKLITLSERTTKDTDKLVRHLDNLIPIHKIVESVSDRVSKIENDCDSGIKPKTHKEMFYYFVGVAGAYAIWITLFSFSIDKRVDAHEILQKEITKGINKKIEVLENKAHYNKNQITYLKGRIRPSG